MTVMNQNSCVESISKVLNRNIEQIILNYFNKNDNINILDFENYINNNILSNTINNNKKKHNISIVIDIDNEKLRQLHSAIRLSKDAKSNLKKFLINNKRFGDIKYFSIKRNNIIIKRFTLIDVLSYL